ncbi:rhodanese-like domain-containing protein [Octadecabacter sp.]|nr:rhodanese-like domain-containing protein [Octadecabacter sp.]
MKIVAARISMSLWASMSFANALMTSIDPEAVPDFKTTLNGQYLSSLDVYNLVVSEPAILFVDVRDRDEVAGMGHPYRIDAVVPVQVGREVTTGMTSRVALVDNPDFLSQMEETLRLENKSRHDLIIITCGSGRRSAIAANILYENGYTNVWHVPDGYDGDDVVGFNVDNAWRLAGLPWSIELMDKAE